MQTIDTTPRPRFLLMQERPGFPIWRLLAACLLSLLLWGGCSACGYLAMRALDLEIQRGPVRAGESLGGSPVPSPNSNLPRLDHLSLSAMVAEHPPSGTVCSPEAWRGGFWAADTQRNGGRNHRRGAAQSPRTLEAG